MVAEPMAGEQPVELSGKEQTVQSAVRQNAAGSRRAAWRVTSVEHVGETEGNDENLIPSASTGEQKVFYCKMKGDYYQFLAEFATGDPGNEVAQGVVDMPVVLQRQVTTIQRTHKTVEVPKMQYIGEIIDVLVAAQHQVPTVQAVQKAVEVPQV